MSLSPCFAQLTVDGIAMVKHPRTSTECHYWSVLIETVTVKDPPDVLDRQKCLDALAALRHAKWFQVRLFVLLYFAALCYYYLPYVK